MHPMVWGTLALAWAAPPPRVLVPPTSGPECEGLLELRERLERSSGLWVQTDGADAPDDAWRVSVTRNKGQWRVELKTPDLTREATGLPALAIERAWPPSAPPLAPALLAPSAEVVRQLCRKRTERALDLAGDALGPALARRGWPKGRAPLPGPYGDWAEGMARFEAGRSGGLAALQRADRALARGEYVPLWRTPTLTSTAGYSRISAVGDGLYAFHPDGRLERLDPRHGRVQWTHRVGSAEAPQLASADLLVVVGLDRVLALEASTGALSWAHPLPGAHRGLALGPTTVVLAGRREVIALELATGAVRWSHELHADIPGGPVATSDGWAIAAGPYIYSIDREGALRPRPIGLGDEVSAPLLAQPGEPLWAFVGSHTITAYQLRSRAPLLWLEGLDGLAWPPLTSGERLVVAREHRRREEVLWLDAQDGSLSRTTSGGRPLVARGDFRGVLHPDARRSKVIVSSLDGRPEATISVAKGIADLATRGRLALVGARDRVSVLDIPSASVIAEVFVSAPVEQVALGPGGGAALLRGGAISGIPLPGDARLQWVRAALREDLARVALAEGRPREALEAARALSARAPESWTARGLEAEALEASRDPAAFEAFARLAFAAPLGSALEQKALAGLERFGARPLPGALESSLERASGPTPVGTPTWDGTGLGVEGGRRARLPRAPIHIAWARSTPVAIVWDGDELVAFDLERGRALGSVPLAGVTGLGGGEDEVVMQTRWGTFGLKPSVGLGRPPL